MTRILVVGSGASGVHFALTALAKGHEVTMLDVGHTRPDPPLTDSTFDQLKDKLDDPAAYFLGPQAQTVVYPAQNTKYYGFPPSKQYVFTRPTGFAAQETGFEALISFARGGLAEAWTGGVYAFNDGDLADFPFRHAALAPYYREVAQRIGISAANDDIAQFSPFDPAYLHPLDLDPHSHRLLERYATHRDALHRRLGFYLGRSRVATLSRDYQQRRGCDYLGRCLWGCPNGAIYTPSASLDTLRGQQGFDYRPGLLAEHFEYDDGGQVTALVARDFRGGQRHRFSADRFVLAAGTLCSSKILLDSVFRQTGRVERLPGLMDNRQIMVPFLTLGMLGQALPNAAYQFHQLALGITAETANAYVHGQITTLKASAVHPIVQSIPLDLRAAIRVFRHIHSALAVANVWLHDTRRTENYVTIRPAEDHSQTQLVIHYGANPEGEDRRLARVRRILRRALRTLGCVVPPGMAHVLPRGSSIHYAGTIPMSETPTPYTSTSSGQIHPFTNLYGVDGAVLPFLPAKNPTYTLMANAARIADVTL